MFHLKQVNAMNDTINVKTKFTHCRDCKSHINWRCVEGSGFTTGEDGCEKTFFNDPNMTEFGDVCVLRKFRHHRALFRYEQIKINH